MVETTQLASDFPNIFGADLTIGVLLCDRPVSERWVEAFKSLEAPGGLSVGRHLVLSPGLDKLPEIEAARNQIASQVARELGPDSSRPKLLFFLDDDVIAPADTLVKLVDAMSSNPKNRVTGGLYRQRIVNVRKPGNYLVWRGDYRSEVGNEFVLSWEEGQQFTCSGLGGGCMLIDAWVFGELKPPFFRSITYRKMSRSNPDGYVVEIVSDDVLFCQEVVDAGFKIVAHGGVLCEHERQVLDRNFRLSQL